MLTFIENYLHFLKNCIRPPYEKLISHKSGFIENSNFENNRDPWRRQKEGGGQEWQLLCAFITPLLPSKGSPWGMPPLFSDVSPWCLNSLCQRAQLGEALKSGFNQVHNWPNTTSLSNWMQESAAGCTYKAKGVRCGPCRAQSISYAMHMVSL